MLKALLIVLLRFLRVFIPSKDEPIFYSERLPVYAGDPRVVQDAERGVVVLTEYKLAKRRGRR